MEYKLAKQLKENGFPQDGNGYWTCEHGGHGVGTRVCGEETYIPTLEELIEACGDGFESLTYIILHNWSAKDRKTKVEYDGRTPTEAVAKLWLELNK